ncbi:MAG: hypothetical protein AVDCRST_MAG23-128 [uncultured Sphingosinicella sp.]|uniref:KfrA N-terminal DNA-binding domain-containing protein n=1 Tax=uncultured Sphingosinicella sp. TaxID=478748 RepID=A0A6J4TEA4_9SPHN|nr:MAG: hypothetical protein AVDCRST_MAG23-128 [uncultured Sphingosinicella sp.]
MTKSVLERAFELARSGSCRSVAELELRLKREGYEAAASHLRGQSIRKQLRAMVSDARSERQRVVEDQ